MGIHYLVINENKDAHFRPYRENYKLFATPEQALAHAKSIGYEGAPLNPKPGLMNFYACGDVKVSILGLDES